MPFGRKKGTWELCRAASQRGSCTRPWENCLPTKQPEPGARRVVVLTFASSSSFSFPGFSAFLWGLILLFSCSSCAPENHSPGPIAVLPSISTVPCISLDQLLSACYPSPCLQGSSLTSCVPVYPERRVPVALLSPIWNRDAYPACPVTVGALN